MRCGMQNYGGYGGQAGACGGMHGGFFIALIVVAVIVLIIYLARKNPSIHVPTFKSNQALDLLDERYAKGEVGQEEYLKTKNDLNSKK